MNFKLNDSGAFEAEFEYGRLEISSNPEIGFRPVQLLVSSIVGCSGGLLRTVLEKKRIPFETIHIDADIERDEKRANKVTKIALHYTVIGKDLSIEQVEKSLKVAMKHCSMVESVKDSIEVVETVEVKEG